MNSIPYHLTIACLIGLISTGTFFTVLPMFISSVNYSTSVSSVMNLQDSIDKLVRYGEYGSARSVYLTISGGNLKILAGEEVILEQDGKEMRFPINNRVKIEKVSDGILEIDGRATITIFYAKDCATAEEKLEGKKYAMVICDR